MASTISRRILTINFNKPNANVKPANFWEPPTGEWWYKLANQHEDPPGKSRAGREVGGIHHEILGRDALDLVATAFESLAAV